MTQTIPRIAITAGEPAGIGPDLLLSIALQPRTSELIAIGDPALLRKRANQLGVAVDLQTYAHDARPAPGKAGTLLVDTVELNTSCEPGVLNTGNAPYVLQTLKKASEGCLRGEFAAMVTAPVQKSVIVEAGYPFSGHTEYLADICNVDLPVMLLCADSLRVALLTTHLPLAQVPSAITAGRIIGVSRTLVRDLERLFGIQNARIALLGLNPHAGESGKLGREELDVIIPAVETLRRDHLNIDGPLPADSAFTPASLKNYDAVLAMYHDQGLPVLKYAGFGHAVNITLGLPIIRTSVDHGTALSLAGTGEADAGSLLAAIQLAEQCIERTQA